MLEAGADRLAPMAAATMDEVRTQDGSSLTVMFQDRRKTRDGRLISALLVLGVVALFFVVVGLVAQAFFFFGDVFLTFFLAWLLAFIISPIVGRLIDLDPRIPRALAAVIVYTLVVAILGRPRDRGSGRAGDLDRPVRGLDPGHPGEPADDPRAVAGRPGVDRAWARWTSSPRRTTRWPTSTSWRPPLSSRSSRSPLPASAPSARC